VIVPVGTSTLVLPEQNAAFRRRHNRRQTSGSTGMRALRCRARDKPQRAAPEGAIRRWTEASDLPASVARR